MITAGMDCGAKNTKAVIMKDGKVIGKGLAPTGFEQGEAVRKALSAAIASAGIAGRDVQRFGGTGSGKNAMEGALMIDEIKAIGRCARHLFSSAGTVTDVGAEEGRAARLDGQGNVLDFAVNERCAAGAGAFIEAMARALETPLTEMGTLALKSQKEIPMNGQCAVFAEAEVVGLIHAKTGKQDISKAVHDAVASRIVSMIRRIGVTREVVMLGGVALNPGFIEAVRRQLAVQRLLVPEEPEFGAAIGAALLAAEEEG